MKITPPVVEQSPIRLRFNDTGKIIELTDKRDIQYHSIIEELKQSGNIGDYFQFTPARQKELKALPIVRDPDDVENLPGTFAVLPGIRNFSLWEAPEPYYTLFPAATLHAFRLDKKTWHGIIRLNNTVPGISLQRSNGIIYMDDRDRLAGFNRTFYRFFESGCLEPRALLGKPASGFLDPTPGQLESGTLRDLKSGKPTDSRTLFQTDFSVMNTLGGIQASLPEYVHRTPAGLDCRNRSEEILWLTLPETVDTHQDFKIELGFESAKGTLPLLVIGDRLENKLEPDLNGYLLGTDTPSRSYILKRQSIVQRKGGQYRRLPGYRFLLEKAGPALIFSENGKRKLNYVDFNFIHGKARHVSIGFRVGSQALLKQIRVTGTDQASGAAPLPVVRLKTAGREPFMLNPVNNLELSGKYPALQCYMLENMTEVQAQMAALKAENLKYRMAAGYDEAGFIGTSPAAVAVKEKAARAAATRSTVLLQGETGAGKEVLARFIHLNSARNKRPFIKVDCSTIPKTLLESQLFGHEKGAFTGATEKRKGYFQQADRGTLFLDEIGNLTFEAQAKLLQFVQDRTVVPVGAEQPVHLDIRLLSASNVPLYDLVKQGKFRADLFYRLDVVTVDLPRLSERIEDIPGLCGHFLDGFNAIHNKNIRDLSPEAYKKLFEYPWPGNIRELRNTLERAVVFCDGSILDSEHISFRPAAVFPTGRGKNRNALADVEENELGRLYKRHRGVMSKVARELHVSPRALYYRMKKIRLAVKKLRNKSKINK
jgi:Nif-specific regulatory protein